MKKFFITLAVCVLFGTGITFGTLKFVDNYLYKLSQSSYVDIETYRTSSMTELKDKDIISIPDKAKQLQFSYNNKCYAYIEDGSIHIYTIDDKKEYTVVTEDNPICYFYLQYDKNAMLYFVEDTTRSNTTLTMKSFEIATKKTTEYNDINIQNFSRVKDVTLSPLLSVTYINIETKVGSTINNRVYSINLFNSMSQVKSGTTLSKIMMFQHIDRLYYGDTKGGVYSMTGGTLNHLVGYDDLELIGINSELESSDDDEKLFLLDQTKKNKVYVVMNNRIIDTIELSDTNIVTTFNEYGNVYLIYPTYILNITGRNPYKRVAKLSKYVIFEAIKGDTVYLRTSNNKIVTTKLLAN